MKPLLLIGCGNMGGALLARWRELFADISGIDSGIDVVDPVAQRKFADVAYFKTIDELGKDSAYEMIVLAVKPQQLDDLLPLIARRFGNSAAYLSIAAGKTIAYYKEYLGKEAAIIRAMPNSPALIGEGATALVAAVETSPAARLMAERLMAVVGKTVWLADEKLIDIVTAISGSGPAYFFMFMSALIEAAVKNGLSPEIARMLVKQTAIGAGKLADISDCDLRELIDNVTSAGGTTAAARAVLEKDQILNRLINEAVTAAVNRAKEL